MTERGGGVTTIIPVFNRAAMLAEAVASVAAQNWPGEIVIVDDGSTDDTPAACDALAAAHPEVVRVIHQANGGPGAARAAGQRIASGEFIQFLDSDDRLLPGKFAAQVAALQRDPGCAAAYGWTRLIVNGVVHDQPWKRTGERIETMFPSMLQSRWWATPTALYRASVLRQAGSWTNLRMEEDWEYDCRIAVLGGRLAYVEQWVSDSVFHGNQLSFGTGAQTPATLRDRAAAHELILGHARAAGIGPDVPEMQHFARELFLLARQCGAAGLPAEARRLFALARDASGPRRNAKQFRVYSAVAGLVGWTNAGRLSALLDTVRR